MGMFIGTGTIIDGPNFSGCVTEISGPSPSRESIDFTCMDESANRQFYPTKLVDWGECTISVAFDASISSTKDLITEGVSAYTINFGEDVSGNANDTWSFSAFCTGVDPTTPLEDKATADITIKLTGGVSTGA